MLDISVSVQIEAASSFCDESCFVKRKHKSIQKETSFFYIRTPMKNEREKQRVNYDDEMKKGIEDISQNRKPEGCCINDLTTIFQGMEGNEKFAPFKDQIQKLLQALEKSLEHEKILSSKCTTLTSELDKSTARLKEMSATYEQDKRTIALLKQDNEKAWASVDEGKEREKVFASSMERLQNEMNKVSDYLNKERARAIKQEEDFEVLTRENADLKNQRDDCKNQIQQLRIEIEETQKENKDLDKNVTLLSAEVDKLSSEISVKNIEIEGITKKLMDIQVETDEIRSKFELKTKECVDLQFKESSLQKKCDRLTKDLQHTKKKMTLQATQCGELSKQTQELSATVESQKNKMMSVCHDLSKKREELKLSLATQSKIVTEKEHLQRKFAGEYRNGLRLQQSCEDARSIAHDKQKEIQILHQALDKANKREDQTSRDYDILKRENNVLLDKIQKYEQHNKGIEKEIRLREQNIFSLEKELLNSRERYDMTTKKVTVLENACEKQSNQLSQERNATESATDTVKLREIEIDEFKKGLKKWETRSSDQELLNSKLRSERSKVSRQLTDSQNETKQVQSQMNVLNNEVKSLQKEISNKDKALVKMHFEANIEKKQKEQARADVLRTKQHSEQQQEYIHKQSLEIQRLNGILKRLDDDILEQKKEYDQVINERDLLGAQIVARNDEIALLQERLKIQDVALKKGEAQYKNRVTDVRYLTIQLQDMKREMTIKNGKPNEEEKFASDLARKEKELLDEKIKVKVLSEELENPLNVHRWRKLEGSDPPSYELIQKVESLQKRLIKKTELLMEKDIIIEELQKKEVILQRQTDEKPTENVREKLTLQETELREKERKLKAFAGELNMHESQVNIYKQELKDLKEQVKALNSELREVKERELRRELELLSETEEQYEIPNQILAKPLRFIGGGFKF